MALYAYIGQWNRKLQCFPVRITEGSQNMQWMSTEEIEAVTVEYHTDFCHMAKATAYCREIGAVPGNYSDAKANSSQY